jgi:hypothetical protein
MITKLSLAACLLGQHNPELNIAICEWLGWKKVTLPNSRYQCGSHGCKNDTHIRWVHEDDRYSPILHEGQSNLPDHILGLTALGNMALAEERLTEDQRHPFIWNLSFLVGCIHADPDKNSWLKLHASALHRCIALLQTVKPEMFTE